jgi:hypothetical protein
MDEQEIVDRAEVVEDPGDLFPNGAVNEPRWVAEDPETGSRGIGQFELEARVNLVHAVIAHRDDPETDVGYVSVGRDRTYEMKWRSDAGLADRVRDALSL